MQTPKVILPAGPGPRPLATVHLAARAIALLAALLAPQLLSAPAGAVSIASKSESTPYAGIRLVEGRTSSPSTDFKAAYISLCSDYVHVTGSRHGPLQSTGGWALSAGVQLAVNADFFKYTAGKLHIYGDAVTQGIRWPSVNTGTDLRYENEWYHMRYGWFGFGPNWANFSHTRYVKRNRELFGQTSSGWRPFGVTTDIPADTRTLVSGFPALVVDGQAYTCTSARSTACFPDRADMRARHPRTAMGLSEDRRTLLLVTVDGRSSRSAGMYGTELAGLMKLLGAHTATNLDGGGSTQMWVKGRGTINRPSDGSPRAVANHLGVFAGRGSGQPRTPGSCLAPGYPNLEIEASWVAATDLDLYLKTPAGNIISYRARESQDGGTHMGDNCIRGNCVDGNREFIRWTQSPPQGAYEVWVVNYTGTVGTTYTVRVRSNNTTLMTFAGQVAPARALEGPRHSFTL